MSDKASSAIPKTGDDWQNLKKNPLDIVPNTPQIASTPAQAALNLKRGFLKSADILTLQRTIGNRALQRITTDENLTMPAESRATAQERAAAAATAPIEVTVIDNSDFAGWLAAFTRTGEVYMQNTQTMVNNVLRASGTRLISRLNIVDHGNPNGVQIGSDWIGTANFSRFAPHFQRLRGHFTGNGFAHFQHCEAGQNLPLLRLFARTLNVPIYAGTGMNNSAFRFNLGDYVRVNPDGSHVPNTGQP